MEVVTRLHLKHHSHPQTLADIQTHTCLVHFERRLRRRADSSDEVPVEAGCDSVLRPEGREPLAEITDW